ncbi:post-GPI attachment to proteins factor 3-like isoform X2 [Pomacea canaliculata]|uniref:post-GPI attachment to proteins factor 3-like isoform X2 n=1 Tax=Pomacea canaliculata TaxID=400727 RepID=UPI000D7339B5|nr:post-GPI attachment to proteins factor 3-like isoform X2 [Pomacea canaliculata]
MPVPQNKLLTLLFMVRLCAISKASVGDRSYIYNKCLNNCFAVNCTDTETFIAKQSFVLRLLRWSCPEECRYLCMWETVDAFRQDGTPVPQFHGKEPASATFSLLNAASHLMLFQYRAVVPPSTPMYIVWHGLALVSVNAWMWSIIFHARDTDFTELMDYMCALSVVLYNVFALCCRFHGTKQQWRPALSGFILMTVFAQHFYYMAFVKFDYGYNMMFNITIGFFNILGWIAWSIKNRKHRYVWQCVATVIAINCLLLLELLDFPPLLWTFDAHSLWHAGTAPLGLLWWRFIINDGLHLKHEQELKKRI